MTRGRVGLAAAGVVALAMLTGCNTTEPGTPNAVGSGGTSASATPKPSTSTTGTPTTGATSSAGDIKPCSLLPDADAASMGLGTPGKAKTVAGVPGCVWTASGQFVASIGIDNKGLNGAPGEKVTLFKHKANKSVDLAGASGCGFALEISDKASALIAVSLTNGKPGAEACPQAEKIAKVVDSTLP